MICCTSIVHSNLAQVRENIICNFCLKVDYVAPFTNFAFKNYRIQQPLEKLLNRLVSRLRRSFQPLSIIKSTILCVSYISLHIVYLGISKFTIYIITSFSYNPPCLLLANLRNFRTTIHKYTQYLPISLISFLNNSPYLLFSRLRNFRTSNTHTHIQSKIAAKCTTYPLDLRDFSIIHRIYQPKIKKFSNHEILNR